MSEEQRPQPLYLVDKSAQPAVLSALPPNQFQPKYFVQFLLPSS